MSHLLITAATLAATLAMAAPAAVANDYIVTGKVSNTSISYGDTADGTRTFAGEGLNGHGFYFVGKASGQGYIGRFMLRGADEDHPAFYRVDMGVLILLDTGEVCTDPGTPKAACQ